MLDLARTTVGDLLDAIGARTPAPGGGAVASVTGALGAALGEMALRYSIRKSSPDDLRSSVGQAIESLVAARARFLNLADDDARAYAELNRLQRLPEDDEVRQVGWKVAVEQAIAAPMATVTVSREALQHLDSVMEFCSKWLLSDLAIAADLLASANRAAAWNVRVNLPLLDTEESKRARYEGQVEDALRATSSLAESIIAHCQSSRSG
ncbi:MAG: cyclodeaminase/cyclohydrolase family protein [Phycisphaerales bacterium]